MKRTLSLLLGALLLTLSLNLAPISAQALKDPAEASKPSSETLETFETIPDTPAMPGPVQGLKGRSTIQGTVLTWEGNGSDAYAIYSLGTTGKDVQYLSLTSNTKFTILEPSDGVTFYTVFGVNRPGKGQAFGPMGGYTYGVKLTAPEKPSKVNVQAVDGGLEISWNVVQGLHYDLYDLGTDGKSNNLLQENAQSPYTHALTEPGRRLYRVVSRNDQGLKTLGDYVYGVVPQAPKAQPNASVKSYVISNGLTITGTVTDMTDELIALQNAERARHGVGPLHKNNRFQSGLTVRAAEAAWDMDTTRVLEWAHTRPNGTWWTTAFYGAGGVNNENITAWTDVYTPEHAHQCWTDSPGHYSAYMAPHNTQTQVLKFTMDSMVNPGEHIEAYVQVFGS